MAAILIAGVGLALVAGCGGGAEDSRREDGSRSDPPPLAGPLVYERSGGAVGRKSRIELQRDGRATFATERIGERAAKLEPAELEEVTSALARVDLAELPAKILPAEPIPDTFGNEVTYQGETVYSEDEADDVPDELAVLTARLSVLVDRYAPKRRR